MSDSASLIDLAAAKVHLRLDDDQVDEDALIERLIDAAYLAVSGKIFRTIYETAVPLTDPEGVVVDAAINAAVLLVLGHLYANREAVAVTSAVAVPMGAEWLLAPYVNYSGGA